VGHSSFAVSTISPRVFSSSVRASFST